MNHDPGEYPVTLELTDEGIELMSSLIGKCQCPACNYLRQCMEIMQSDGQTKH